VRADAVGRLPWLLALRRFEGLISTSRLPLPPGLNQRGSRGLKKSIVLDSCISAPMLSSTLDLSNTRGSRAMLLNVTAAAKELGLGVSTLRALIRRGALRSTTTRWRSR
jgi:hypothetical protein